MFMHSLVEVGESRCRGVFFVLRWRETGRQGEKGSCYPIYIV